MELRVMEKVIHFENAVHINLQLIGGKSGQLTEDVFQSPLTILVLAWRTVQQLAKLIVDNSIIHSEDSNVASPSRTFQTATSEWSCRA